MQAYDPVSMTHAANLIRSSKGLGSVAVDEALDLFNARLAENRGFPLARSEGIYIRLAQSVVWDVARAEARQRRRVDDYACLHWGEDVVDTFGLLWSGGADIQPESLHMMRLLLSREPRALRDFEYVCRRVAGAVAGREKALRERSEALRLLSAARRAGPELAALRGRIRALERRVGQGRGDEPHLDSARMEMRRAVGRFRQLSELQGRQGELAAVVGAGVPALPRPVEQARTLACLLLERVQGDLSPRDEEDVITQVSVLAAMLRARPKEQGIS